MIAERMDQWLTRRSPSADPMADMQAAGLFAPATSYREIAGIEALLTQRTGLLGLGSVWAGRQVTARYFLDGFGDAAQRAAWSASCLAVAISEPGVGAHPKRLTTQAERDGDGFRIDGEKAWVSNGPSADAFIVLAITAIEGERKRYSAFLVPRDAPGLSLKELPRFHALRPSRHCGLLLHDVSVPGAAMLGREGSAYETMAMPFRDVEDAVGVFGLLGALRFLLDTLRKRPQADEAATLELGGLVALTAVFEDAAEAVLAALDAGELARKSATLVGLRVLAAQMMQQVRRLGLEHDPACDEVLRDLEASLAVARGPRQARQIRLATLSHNPSQRSASAC